MEIVAFTGKKGSGKSTACEILRDRGYTILAFADPLKHLCKEIFGLTEAQLNDPREKEKIDPRYTVSPRVIMQQVGTTLFRDLLPKLIPHTDHIWIKSMAERMKGVAKMAISDLRFEDEADFLRAKGALIVHIIRDGGLDDHISEKGIEIRPGDIVLHNTSLESFKRGVFKLISDKDVD